MTFEEQLQRPFETVTARLRDEIARELQFVSVDVAASAHGEREAAAKEAAAIAIREHNARAEAMVSAAPPFASLPPGREALAVPGDDGRRGCGGVVRRPGRERG